MRIRPAAALVSAALLLTACTAEVRGVASPEASLSSPPSTSAPGASTPPGQPSGAPGEDTQDKAGPALPGTAGDPAGSLHVTGFRAEAGLSSVRLVVGLSGNGVPDWTVAYADATGPDGAPVDVAGDAFLRVRVRSAAGPTGRSESRMSLSPGPVAEARTTGVADGYEEVLIGVRGGPQPFSVEALTDPGRLVVEIRGAG